MKDIIKWRLINEKPKELKFKNFSDGIFHKFSGLLNFNKRKSYLRNSQIILDLENEFSNIIDSELQRLLNEKKTVFRLNRDTEKDLFAAFAMIREVAWRIRKEKHYKVQIAGALAIYAGNIAEMATGEGKTLTAVIPAIIAGWRGKGCHVITVNDYLAKRDAIEMTPLYNFCGVSVEYIISDMEPAERKITYLADVTYCTNKDVVADYLRDKIALNGRGNLQNSILKEVAGKNNQGLSVLMQRGLEYAIIDEIDSVLIDEATTPVIISGEGENKQQSDAYQIANEIVKSFNKDEHYSVNLKTREVIVKEKGDILLDEKTENLDGIWNTVRRKKEILKQAISAKELFIKNDHYIIKDDKIVIIDESTGRLMPDRSWRQGIHELLELKEEVELSPPKETYEEISFQRFFNLYNKVSGLTGTASEASDELWSIYDLSIVKIPPNKKCIRKIYPTKYFTTLDNKWNKIVNTIKEINKTGQPILIGTRSVDDSKTLSQLLFKENLEHSLLNAENDENEAVIIKDAGQSYKITVATNMAGRGTDIKLSDSAKSAGGLFVIVSEKNESPRVDRQLIGRCSRQGDAGTAQFFLSCEDKIFTKYFSKKRIGIIKTTFFTNLILNRIFSLLQYFAKRTAKSQRKNVFKNDCSLYDFLAFSRK